MLTAQKHTHCQSSVKRETQKWSCWIQQRGRRHLVITLFWSEQENMWKRKNRGDLLDSRQAYNLHTDASYIFFRRTEPAAVLQDAEREAVWISWCICSECVIRFNMHLAFWKIWAEVKDISLKSNVSYSWRDCAWAANLDQNDHSQLGSASPHWSNLDHTASETGRGQLGDRWHRTL